ncbi:transcription factor VBP [Ooceraea biroi]|nr:transcription factor VBP [Ooceraea biroi]EZA50644.1 hypothetical protein X777_10995 [Ooceraea biroi]
MESELLKEPWVFPRTKATSTKEEDTFCTWEEDFQDLSGWCMDTFQGHFHIGESTPFKLSGTKYEGNEGISTVEEKKVLKDLKSTVDDEKWDLRMDNVKTIEESGDNHLLLSPSELANEQNGKGYNTYNEENNATSSWLMSPESTASTSTSSSKQHNNADVGASIQSEYRARKSSDYACPTPSLDAIVNQQEMWDELRTIETTGSDSFDLLSYLWEDEIRSPEGSVSTDSSAILKVRQHTTTAPSSSSSSAFPPVSTKVKTEINEPMPPTRRRMETRASSTVTSSSLETPIISSRRSERIKTMPSSNKEKERIMITRTKREKSGRKRYYESESEEDVALSQYREGREKNNEASRRSRMNKKAKESEMTVRAIKLERDNRILKMKVEELEKLVTSMRSALLRSALKKEF